MKILLIDAIASYVDFALRCEAAGHEVRVFCGPDPKGLRHPAGDGLIDKVAEWQPHMRWADLICTSDNTKYVKELEGYRKQGYPIFGCNVECAAWELARDVGVEIFEAAGIKTIPSILFKNYDEAIAHVDANPLMRYVSKPLGDADRALSYVSKSSRDLRFMLVEWKKHAPRHPFIFQEFHGGIEVAVGAWVGRNGFGKYCLENFEHKKLMNDEIGPNCYSADTEVMTKAGWKTFDKVTLEDEVASYQPADGNIFYERPTALHWADYEGPMVNFQSRYADVLVTPSHQMWAARRKTNSWKFYDAAMMPSEFTVKQFGEYSGHGQTTFTLPSYIDGRGFAHADLEIPLENWAEFLGLYLSEGSCDPDGGIRIAQEPGAKADAMARRLQKLPWTFNQGAHGFKANSVQLVAYLRQFGLSPQKFVPEELKYASAEIAKLFLDMYLLGDGDLHYGNRRWVSGSYQIISDIQEMLTLHGSTGVITTDLRTEMVNPLNQQVYTAQPVYSIEEVTRKECGFRDKTLQHYSGKIGCVTLPTTHILFVRRKGRVIACGNTGEMGTVMKYVPMAESLLAQKLLVPLEAALIRSGYTGYLDVAVIIDKKGVCWPLEFTTRPGWPLFQIQQVLHREPAQWMLDAVNGTDSFEPYPDVAVGIVVAIKDFPYNFQPREVMCGFPVWGLTEKNRYYFHPAEMMLGAAPELEKGKLVQVPMMVTAGSYVGVVSGVGAGVEAAVDHAYGNLRHLEFANSPMYRTDIGKRVCKQLPELQAMGYMTGWEL